MQRTQTKQKGQVLPLIIFLLAVGTTMMVIMFNNSQKATEKTIATNAADASAYSAGVWVSRNLNYLAYTNRAMIANYVAVGHAVTYISWLRYVQDTIDNINSIAQYIPGVGQYTTAVKQAVDMYVPLAEYATTGITVQAEVINRLIEASQLSAKLDLSPYRIQEVMEAVAVTYNPIYQVNQVSQLHGVSEIDKARVAAAIAKQSAILIKSVSILSTEDDTDLAALIKLSYADSYRWLTDRRWKKTLVPGLVKIRKNASTDQSLNNSPHWKSNDSLELGKFKCSWRGCRWKWSTIGSGKAETEDFIADYQGINTYANLNAGTEKKPENGWESNAEDGLSFELVALTSISDISVTPDKRMNIKSKGTAVTGLGRARVYFKKPEEGFSGHRNEVANVFNPFWQVKLVAPWP